MSIKIKDLIRVKKSEAEVANRKLELKKPLIITQINKHLKQGGDPSIWFPGLLYKGVKRSNV